MSLTKAQVEQLLRPINPRRVGKDGKGFSHLEAYDVRAHLTRLFGFGEWSAVTNLCELVFESVSDDQKPRWTVCYRAKVTLTVHATGAAYSEWAAGDATNYPSRADAHDMAMKTAESQALKRCAVNLGDQFGLSLYARGSLQPVVGRTLAMPEAEHAAQAVDEHVTEVVPEGEPAADPREMSSPPTTEPVEEDGKAQTVADSAIGADKKTLARLTIESRTLWREKVTSPDGSTVTLKALLDGLARGAAA